MISSRAISPRVALGMTALANFIGPFIFGVADANTIGHELVAAETISTQVLVAALLSAILWNLPTWYLGFPSSSSHALIGGFVGAVVIAPGWQRIQMHGLWKILIALFASPVIRYLMGYVVLRIVMIASARFMQVFFQELLSDGQIDRAMTEARFAVREHPDHWVPVLFTRLVTGRLWNGFFNRHSGPRWSCVLACV